ncbi:SGNH/GDSL hydrolase family protein [Sphingomonas sp. IC4-52]|uniref:SGNH/GDSL hydrolase family protein n=1 Tax=Sphingomonas sp. IC4-52 TaxID=2887202 RepID=UPI001D1229CA|nr:SGNH/GDSL hydrolase family protein [Sphingomonas sp. IC4-52]MCC2980701.1 SGNH/GDSL hydrolase family protein [Sphingomonas sp. IC4-52]
MSGRDILARGMAARARDAVGTSTRHGRLLRAAEAAVGRNPAVLRSWLPAPAYAPNSAYAVGQVVTHGGSWYMCGVGGVSPSVGPGPVNTSSGQYLADGGTSLYWAYLGGARAPDPADGAPIVSVVTSNPAIGVAWTPAGHPKAYVVRGAAASPLRGNFWSLTSFEANAGMPTCAGASVSFACDGEKVALFLPAGSAQIRVLVDGRYLMPGSHVAAGQDQWMVIDWTASTGRRLRHYEVETGKSASYFGGVQAPASAIVSAAGAGAPRMVVIGDSYNAGSSYGPWLAGGSVAQLLAKRLGWRDTWNLSVGGTGYCNPSATGLLTFGERVPRVLSLAPDVILLMGSTNDVGYTPSAVQAAVAATLKAIRAGTAAPVVVVGVPSINLPGAPATEAAIAAAVAQHGDPLTFFVPICGALPPWVLGPWNNGTGVPGGTANASFYVAADNVHPPEIGFDYYAQRIEQAIRSAVLPALTAAA